MTHENSNTRIYDQLLIILWFIIPSHVSLNEIKSNTLEWIYEYRKQSKKMVRKFLWLEGRFWKYARGNLKRNTFFLGTPHGVLFLIVGQLSVINIWARNDGRFLVQ